MKNVVKVENALRESLDNQAFRVEYHNAQLDSILRKTQSFELATLRES